MKKNLLYLFITFSSISFSQTLEKSYITEGDERNFINYVFISSNNNLYYLTLDNNDNKLKIYNNDHTLYKDISLTIPGGYNLNRVIFSSDLLFNSDSKFEILISLEGNGVSKLVLFNEDGGDSIFDFGDKWTANVFKDGNNYKLITSKYHFSSGQVVHYDIYSLSGTLSTSQENLLNQQKMISFPNPSSDIINITNPLKNNARDKVKVYDINGRKVLEKEIIGNGENIELNISDLSKGIYNYRIRDFGNKFVKE
jgi:hypothetical protein